ncbi:hypothetical protein [Lutispora thermophila]|uniref:hypothetical protein n=1 Tax=Lutispora thermophila TaxID=288966 RepID=UPI001586F9A0|nr:hypothetical protein [Lutispora thermophila]
MNYKPNGLEQLGYNYVIVDCEPQRSKNNDEVLHLAACHRQQKVVWYGPWGAWGQQ